uniref:Meiotically up-regulated protein C8C9.04 n=1 Tax=Lygus hesperus TaxID=30085 RepID=A0A0A9XHH1_LYGHE
MVGVDFVGERVKLEVAFVTFNDDQLPGSCIVNAEEPNSFVLTSGGFPHEVLCATCAACAHINKIKLVLHDAKHIQVELCNTERNHDTYNIVLDRTLARGECDGKGNDCKQCQVVILSVNPNKEGKSVKEVRLRILSGHS